MAVLDTRGDPGGGDPDGAGRAGVDRDPAGADGRGAGPRRSDRPRHARVWRAWCARSSTAAGTGSRPARRSRCWNRPSSARRAWRTRRRARISCWSSGTWRTGGSGASTVSPWPPIPSPPVGWVELDQALGEHAAARAERAVAERNLARLLGAGARRPAKPDRRARRGGGRDPGDRPRGGRPAAAFSPRRHGRDRGGACAPAPGRRHQSPARAGCRAGGTGAARPGGAAGVSSRFVVRSPIAGVIEAVDLTLGEVVDPARRIFTLVDLAAVWVRAAAYDRDVAAIRQGMPAVVRVQGLGGRGPRGPRHPDRSRRRREDAHACRCGSR